jgi:hypothetical protein
MSEILMVLGGFGTLVATIALVRGSWVLMQVPNRKFASILLVFFAIVLGFGIWMGPTPMPDPHKPANQGFIAAPVSAPVQIQQIG